MAQEVENGLRPIGATSSQPPTYYLWHPEKSVTVEITDLVPDHYLVRASKSYHLLKQSEEGKETRNKKLGQLREYLENTFTHFQITVDYTNHTHSDLTELSDDLDPLAEQSQQLIQQKEELIDELESLELGVAHGFEELQDQLEPRFKQKQQQLEEVENRLEEVYEAVIDRKEALDLWTEQGNSLAYVFTFSTDTQLVHREELEETLQIQIETAYDHHRRRIKQILQGSNMQLFVEELEEPRVFNRLEHTTLFHPEAFKDLKEEIPPELQADLEQLRQQHFAQYTSYTPIDIDTRSGRIERGKQTPTKAVQTLLNDLETVQNIGGSDAPNDGPTIGTIAGTQQVVGYDPSEYRDHGMPHLYIVGGTNSGKTYLKRVLIENCASLGYDVLAITPTAGDHQSIGLNFPHPDSEKSTGITADQYLAKDDRLLDIPRTDEEIDRQLFTGVNAVSLDSLSSTKKQSWVDHVFQRLDAQSKRTTPLFVFLEEAHNFADGQAVDIIEKLSREGRKFGVHLVLSTQEPTDFAYQGAAVRRQLNHVFMKGRFTDYADSFLDSGADITSLNTGQALFDDWEYDTTWIDVRTPLTCIEASPGERSNQISRLDNRYQNKDSVKSHGPSFAFDGNQDHEGGEKDQFMEQPSADLTDKEQEILDWVHEFIKEEDKEVTYSKTSNLGPAGGGNAKQHLKSLVEKGYLTTETTTVGGNEGIRVYRPISNQQ